MSELGTDAEELVRAGRAALRPAGSDRERIREALRLRLAPPAGSQPGAPPPAPPSAGVANLGWSVRSALLVGAVVGGGALFYTVRGSEAQQPPAALVSTPTASSAAVPSSALPAPPSAPAAPEPASTTTREEPRVTAAARPADRLAEEVAILSRAETELHGGHYANALRILDEHQRRFPHGTLAQERVAARIHALCGLGKVTEARAEMARMAPGSLHEESVRGACAPSSK